MSPARPGPGGPGGGRPLVAGNWKMHLNHLEAIAHVQRIAFSLGRRECEQVEVAVLAPFTDLRSVQTLIDGDRLPLAYGAQDVSAESEGAYTGEISAAMLARLGTRYVLVGHSERRARHGEADATVAAKAAAALAHGITPIVCVGEPLEVRAAGDHLAAVSDSLRHSVRGLDPAALGKLVCAYEPVWAIGTGQVAGPEDAQQMAAALRAVLTDLGAAGPGRLLYGGSVGPDNAAELLAGPDVDGLLVGGASLDAARFAAIVRAAAAPPGG